MSYEGSREWLCANGHLDSCDCYEHGEKRPCETCGAPTVWQREIDETNGFANMAEYRLQYPCLEVLEPAKTVVCNLGHVHEVAPARYKVPA